MKTYITERNAIKQCLFLDANEHYEQWVKFSSKALDNLNRYPDKSARFFKKKLATVYCSLFNENNLLACAGSIEAIDLLIMASGAKSIAVNYPTYDVYLQRANIHKVKIIEIPFLPDGRPDVTEIIKANADITVLINPNNPTGNLVDRSVVSDLLSEYKGLLLIDEAYIEYTGLANSLQDFVKTHKNVVIIRTFSKAWGLAGLRLGYIIADQVVISLLTPYQNPYSVNRVALYGGMAALDQIENLDINVRNVLEYKANFLQKLQGIPIEVVDTSANFVLITGQHVDKIYEELREQGILVRPRPVNAELKCCLRVTIGSPQEMEQICEAIRGVVNG